MSIKSKSQQRFVNESYRKGYDGIRWDKSEKPDIKPYGGRPILAGVNVVGVVTQGEK